MEISNEIYIPNIIKLHIQWPQTTQVTMITSTIHLAALLYGRRKLHDTSQHRARFDQSQTKPLTEQLIMPTTDGFNVLIAIRSLQCMIVDEPNVNVIVECLLPTPKQIDEIHSYVKNLELLQHRRKLGFELPCHKLIEYTDHPLVGPNDYEQLNHLLHIAYKYKPPPSDQLLLSYDIKKVDAAQCSSTKLFLLHWSTCTLEILDVVTSLPKSSDMPKPFAFKIVSLGLPPISQINAPYVIDLYDMRDLTITPSLLTSSGPPLRNHESNQPLCPQLGLTTPMITSHKENAVSICYHSQRVPARIYLYDIISQISKTMPFRDTSDYDVHVYRSLAKYHLNACITAWEFFYHNCLIDDRQVTDRCFHRLQPRHRRMPMLCFLHVGAFTRHPYAELNELLLSLFHFGLTLMLGQSEFYKQDFLYARHQTREQQELMQRIAKARVEAKQQLQACFMIVNGFITSDAPIQYNRASIDLVVETMLKQLLPQMSNADDKRFYRAVSLLMKRQRQINHSAIMTPQQLVKMLQTYNDECYNAGQANDIVNRFRAWEDECFCPDKCEIIRFGGNFKLVGASESPKEEFEPLDDAWWLTRLSPFWFDLRSNVKDIVINTFWDKPQDKQ